MSVQELLILLLQYALGLLAYSGPLVSLTLALLFSKASREHFRRNLWLLLVLTAIQALSYLPYVFAVTTDTPDSMYRLLVPFGLGALLFIVTLPYCIYECLIVRRTPHHGT